MLAPYKLCYLIIITNDGSRTQGQGLNPQGRGQGLNNCPRGRALVLEDSNTGHLITVG